jgi:hypothetical protein
MESPENRNKEASPKEESGFKNRQPIKSNEVEERTKTRKRRRADRELITNAGIGPGESPNLLEGADADAASS